MSNLSPAVRHSWGTIRMEDRNRRETLAWTCPLQVQGASNDDQREEGFPRHPSSGLGAEGHGCPLQPVG